MFRLLSIISVAFSLKLIRFKNPFKDFGKLIPKVQTKLANGEQALNGLSGLKNFAIESLLGPNLVNVMRANSDAIKGLLSGITQIPQEIKNEVIVFLVSKGSKRYNLKFDTKPLISTLERYQSIWLGVVLGESISGVVLAFFMSLLQIFLLIALYAKVPPKAFLSLCLLMIILCILLTALYASLITTSVIIGSACESKEYDLPKSQIKECINTNNALNMLRINDFELCGKFDSLKCDLPKSLILNQNGKRLMINLPSALVTTLQGTRKFIEVIVQPQLEQLSLTSKQLQPVIQQAKFFSTLLPFNTSLLENALGNIEKLEPTMKDKIGTLIEGNLRTALQCGELGIEAQSVIDSVCKTAVTNFDELHSLSFLLAFLSVIQSIFLLLAVWFASRGKKQKFPTNLFTSFFE